MERWILAGSNPEEYIVGIDQSYNGQSSGFIKCIVENPTSFGTLMQSCKADSYHGKRLRLAAMIRTEDVSGWAGLWMRVDGSKQAGYLAFDNMQDRSIKGTTDWQQYEVVLDVPTEAAALAFGVLVQGSGSAWLAAVKVEEVDAAVLVTASAPQTKPDKPGNLDFSEG